MARDPHRAFTLPTQPPGPQTLDRTPPLTPANESMYSTLPSAMPGWAGLRLRMSDTVTRNVFTLLLCCCRSAPDGIGLGPPSQLNSCNCRVGLCGHCCCGCCSCGGVGCSVCCGASCAAAAELQNTWDAYACADGHVAPSCSANTAHKPNTSAHLQLQSEPIQVHSRMEVCDMC